MKSKKWLALLLTLCMMLSCLSPVAAATTGESAVTRPTHGTSTTVAETVGADSGTVSDASATGSVVTGNEAAINADTALDVPATSTPGSAWTITPVDEDDSADLSALLTENGSAPEALDSVYDALDVVTAFVVLEDEPMAASYSTQAMAPASVAEAYAQQQAVVMSAIHDDIDSSAELVTQFSFLTNSIVLSTEYRNLSKIAELDGVASVFVSPIYYPAVVKSDAEKMTVSSGQMTNVDDVWNLGNGSGYTGKGMTIAILDTGIDCDHPSFTAAPEGAAWDYDTVESLIETYGTKLHAVQQRPSLNADYVYYSEKIPFIFNYALGNNNVNHNDTIGDHGTHVAGIAAANAVEGTGVVGMAPDAQLIAMKVFNPTTGGATLYDYVNALEDCITLGVDVVNLSLGSVAGFSETGQEEVDAIFERIKGCDTIVNIAAGNESAAALGSQYGTEQALTSSVDNATISSPATYQNVMAIASVANNYVMSDYITVEGVEDPVFYQPTIEVLYGYTDIALQELYGGKTFEYVIVDGFGKPEDFFDEDGNSLVDGKIAVVKRGGDIYFGTKTDNAYAAGAVAAIIWNNVSEDIFTFGMTTSADSYDSGEYSAIPAILISLEDGEKMAEAEAKKLTVPTDAKLRMDSKGGQMSSFTSWGPSADLRLVPDLSGIGGNVYSCYDGGVYGLMSGTSMATPQVCGVTALVKQYLKTLNLADRETVEALMMSTANPVISDESEVEASPRQQGAGLVDALKAVTSGAYLTVDGGRPKAELGDSETGVYEFTFEIHNFSESDKTYTLSSSLLCEDYLEYGDIKDTYFMAGYDVELPGTVSFDAENNRVTVKAGGTAEVEVTIEVSDKGIEFIEDHFPNGNYVEGYIYLTDTAEEGGVNLSLPFMGFCGNWNEIPVFDNGYWYDNSYWLSIDTEGSYGLNEDSPVTAEEYWHVPWVSMGVSVNDWLLGLNPYVGMLVDEDGNVRHSDENNVISPNGDGYMDSISDFYLSLLRNARYLWVRYVDADTGEDLTEPVTLIYESKTMYNSSYGTVMPFAYSWYYTTPLYDFIDETTGEPLADGTKVNLVIDAVVDYDLKEKVDQYDDGDATLIDKPDDSLVIPITVDTAKPDLKTVVESTKDGKRYLTLTFEEAHPAIAAITNPAGTQLYDQVYDNEMVEIADGVYTAMLDITGRGDEFAVILGDYGYNQAQFQITREGDGDNSPTVDMSALYAYQVYDLGLYYYYGWDYMFGWSTIDTDLTHESTVNMLNSDAYEYYAINAAEYVDGKIFAVDAGGNFLYVEPGLWNRNTICNIGYNVIDMAFNDENDTMYILISEEADADDYDESHDIYAIATLDLLTGEVKILHNWADTSGSGGGGGGIYFPPVAASYAADDGIASDDDNTYEYVNPAKYDMPWAMTFAGDGYLYCCKFDQPGLYWLDVTDNLWELTPVVDEDWNEIVPALQNGYELSPYYAQSMTYSKEDGKIYWLFCDSSVSSTLVTIDPKDWSYTIKGLGYTEYVGALTLEETDYKIPESPKVTKLELSESEITLAVGDSAQLSVYALPWNAPATEIYWESDDIYGDVIEVSEDGTITAVGAGTALVFACCGDDEDSYVEVECEVTVLNIEGSFRAFNYSGDGDYGTWQDIDLKTMHGTDVKTLNKSSTVEFGAADYNGHDNCIYGFDANTYSAYKLNCETGEVTQLKGSSQDVCDMAYDYYRGIMFVITYDDPTLYAMNLRTGELVPMASFDAAFTPRTLACDWVGNLYTIDTEGYLYLIQLMDNTGDGDIDDGDDDDNPGPIMPPIDAYDDDDDGGNVGFDPGYDEDWGVGTDESGDYPMIAYLTDLMEVPYNAESDYGQSMCYDYNNLYGDDVLYWCNTNLDTFYQIVLPMLDPDYGYPISEGSVYDLGTVDSHVYPQYLGMHVVPEDILWELPDVEVTGISVEFPFLLVGDSTELVINVEPFNANQPCTIVYDGVFSIAGDGSEDDVIELDEETGKITALKAGVAYVSLYVDGLEETYTDVMVTVKNPTTSRIRAYDYLSDVWLGVDQHAPADSSVYGTVRYEGSTYELTAAEYVGTEGLVYGYASDGAFFEPVEYFTVFNGSTLSVKTMTALGSDFPIVYDMAYDYTNGVMYALAGTANVVSLYYVDLADGTLIEIAGMDELGHTFLNIAVNAEGTLYAMTNGDNAELYIIDPKTGTSDRYPTVYTETSNPYKSSLSYDYDTGYLYWTPYEHLYLIDLEDSSTNNMGSLPGENYALMLMAKNKSVYPAASDVLTTAALTDGLVELSKGESKQLSYRAWPSDVDVTEVTWSSSDEKVATVDENGTVKGVASGTAVITVTLNGTVSASCNVIVYGAGDTFVVYNVTDKGFAAVSRTDASKVTNLTQNESASPVSAMTMLEDGTIYAYDEDGKLFTTSVADNFKRNYIGHHGIDVSEYDTVEENAGQKTVATTSLAIRDMTVLADGTMLALGAITWNMHVQYFYNGDIYNESNYPAEPAGIGGSARLYQVNTETGALTELCVIKDSGAEMSGANMLQAAGNSVYVYNTMNDRISLLDTTTGDSYPIVTLQSISVRGEAYQTMGMTYDKNTNCLYLLVNINANYDRMVKYDIDSGLLTNLGLVGGEHDIFHGLLIRNGGDVAIDEPDDNTPVTPSKPSNPSTPSTPEKNTLPFVDVAEGEWYYDAVKYVYENGLMNGVGDGTHFDPDGEVTRAMVVQTLYRMAGSPAVSGSNGFTDLSNDWYLDAVQWAYANGITTGRTDTTFAPDEHVTREELATFFYRYAAFCGCDVSAAADLSGFVDADELGVWAQSAMSWANAKGLILGRGANTLAPKDNAARSELATILMRFRETVA